MKHHPSQQKFIDKFTKLRFRISFSARESHILGELEVINDMKWVKRKIEDLEGGIVLDITEFGIDPEKDKWNTIFMKKTKWRCDDYQHLWFITESIKSNYNCPICLCWDKKKNKKPLTGLIDNSNKEYWWKCIEGNNHSFRMSMPTFQNIGGRCAICYSKKQLKK